MTTDTLVENFPAVMLRGLAFLAGAGGLLGGIAGTLRWPLVGTFFGAIEGAVVGAVVGVLDAVLLAKASDVTRSVWAQRGISGMVSWTFAMIGALEYHGPIVVPIAVMDILVMMSLIAGAFVGPLIGFGVEIESMNHRGGLASLRFGKRLIAWGAGIGGGVGAVAGFIVGLIVFAPTSLFAAIEGGVFGVTAGIVVACLIGAIAVLPRLRAKS
jgi:hypothetical protein